MFLAMNEKFVLEVAMDRWKDTAQAAWEAMLVKVRDLKNEGKTLQEIADILGHGNRSLVSEWLQGNRKAENASFASFMNYLERLGLDYREFFPPAPLIKRIEVNAPVEKVQGNDLQELGVYSVAGAGTPIDVAELTPLFTVFAPPDYLRKADFAIVIDGHSMEPLISHGAVVGIKKDAPFVANELYAARIPYEGMVVKRVGVDMEKDEFIFKSQNPDKGSYPDYRIGINEGEGIIIGRVVWVMWGY